MLVQRALESMDALLHPEAFVNFVSDCLEQARVIDLQSLLWRFRWLGLE